MSADLVVGGLGGDGPIVTAGLGLAGAPDPNALRATITASSTLTAELTATSARRGGAVVASVPINVVGERAPLAAHLAGASALTAHLTGIDRDAEALLLLLDLELSITEGVTL